MRLYPLGCPVEVHPEQPFLAEAARKLWPEPGGLLKVAPLPFTLSDGAEASEPLRFRAEREGFVFQAGDAVEGRFELAGRRGEIRAGVDSAALLLESVVLTALTWTHLLPLHAACVAREGRSLLLCGDSHAGKSTLAYEFAKAGWTYVSDNSLYWAVSEDVLVSGSPVIKLRGRERPVNPAECGFGSARTAVPGPVVFLRRRPGKPALLRESEDTALEYFLTYVTRPDRDAAAAHYRDLGRHGLWRIEYEEAEDAVRCLEQLA